MFCLSQISVFTGKNHSAQKDLVIGTVIQFYLDHRSYEQIKLGAVVFNNVYGYLGKTRDAGELIQEIQKQDEMLKLQM